MFKKIDHAVTVCQQFNKVFDTMTINDLSYYKYEEYKFYTERCFNFINERLPKLQSESKDKVTQKIEFVIKVLEHQLEGSKYLEPKKEISSAMQKDFREIIANEEKMKSEKKDANENGNRLQGVFVNDIIKFDEPNLDQDNNAAPIANNDNYNDDDLPLPSLEDLLNVKRQEQEEK